MINKLKQNKLVLIMFIIAILLIVTGVTYSFYKIRLEGQKTHFVSSDLISFTYKESENKIAITNMTPVSDIDGKKGNYFEFSVSSNLVKDMSVDYEISILKTSTTNSFNESDIKAYLTDENDNSLVEPVIISELEDNSKITNAKTIYQNNFTYNNSNEKQTHTYRLRIWLKNDVDLSKYTTKTETENGTNVTLENHSFKFKVNVNTYEKVNLDTSGANAPVLASNMIPVYYDETNETWKKADISNMNRINQWYSYVPTGKHKGMWANAITVKDTNRQTYLNASPGTEISMDDITTMWVWIPRFDAIMPSNYNGGTQAKPNAIDVTFVKQNEPSLDAFTFGDKQLSGFWYGKFDVSHNSLTNTTTINNLSCQTETCSNANGIIIKPNVNSLRYNNVSNFFFASRSMEQTGNSFGFVNSEVDTHMSKNNEWGAVAYLTHSIYGRCTSSTSCTEVGINNNSNFVTGYGAPAGSSSSVTTGAYNTTLGKDASTTKNIYGIYDMNSTASKYVMMVLRKYSGSDLSRNSGFNGLTYDDGNYTNGVDFPNEKYYNSNKTDGECDNIKGHALGETSMWYGNFSRCGTNTSPWLIRSYDSYRGMLGLFRPSSESGYGSKTISSRFVITNE